MSLKSDIAIRSFSEPFQTPVADLEEFSASCARSASCYESWRTKQDESTASFFLTETFHHKARSIVRVTTRIARSEPISCRTLVLWAAFGASGWWSSNAIFAQLPLLVKTLPEGDTLGSELSAMTQLGNLFMVAYMVARRHLRLDPAALVCGMQLVGTIALVVCACVCSSSALPDKSVPLMVITVVTGGIGCTSGVHYWTFLLLFPARCSVGASVGMALGGVVCNMLAALQFCGRGELEGPRFSSGVFFIIAAVLQLFSMGIFLVITGKQGRTSTTATPEDSNNGLFGDAALLGSDVEGNDGVPQRSWFAFPAMNIALRGVAYLMPTLMPYAAAAYPLRRTQLLFWMLACQQAGETTGRGLEPSNGQAITAAMLALLVFAAFAAGAFYPTVLASIIPLDIAPIVIPAACMYFFLSYGMVETTIFQRIRRLSDQQEEIEDLSAMTGSLGQVGCFSSTLIVYLGFEFHATMAKQH